MAANCFGDVVDDRMLDEMGYAGRSKTQEDRAQMAIRLMHVDDKMGQAIRYVENLKELYGNGASTLCLVYNASGDTLRFAAHQNWWNGSFYDKGYPAEIGNGQWAAFLHVHDQGAATGSIGAVVYSGKNRHGDDRDFLLAWSTPWSLVIANTAYCEIGLVKFYEGRWPQIENRLDQSQYSSNSMSDGVEIEARTERGTSPKFTAIIRAVHGP